MPSKPVELGTINVAEPPVLIDSTPALSNLVVCHPEERDSSQAADAIQGCIDRAFPESSVELLPGTYTLHRQLVLSKPLTLRTVNVEESEPCTADERGCAVLVAAPDLDAQWGPLLIQSTHAVTLEHLVVDGNRQTRSRGSVAQRCFDGDNTHGFNIAVLDCTTCTVNDVVSRNAVCGTGMAWSGAGATIQHSAFRSNGDAATRMWSDGLTLLYAPYSSISDNEFVDNTDVALIIGYGVGARLERNAVMQQTRPSFAGLMLDNFNSNDWTSKGDFRGAVITQNRIDCGEQLCTFGIQIGPRPWYPSQNIIGGELHHNDVRGAKIGINADGAGILAAPTMVYANTIDEPSPSGHFSSCPTRISAEALNVAPNSVVDRRGETTEAAAHLSDSCQLWSGIRGDD